MKVLIIGAKGMLGQELVRVFSSGHEVTGLDREGENFASQIDITTQAARGKIQKLKPNLLINTAAYNDVDGAETNQGVAQTLNGYALRNLAQISNELGIPIVHYSTDYVFDGRKQKGYRESDPPSPVSVYGESKLLGETELQRHAQKFYLIRLSRLFGKRALSVAGKKSFVDLMLVRGRTGRRVEVVDKELSCPTYAPDLAERTRFVVESHQPFGIYHCANKGVCTWFGFAKEIFRIAELDERLLRVAPASFFRRAAKRPKFSILLNTKLPPMRDWREALQEFLVGTEGGVSH